MYVFKEMNELAKLYVYIYLSLSVNEKMLWNKYMFVC